MRRKEEERIVELERKRRALEMRRREGQRQLVKFVSPLGQLDSTKEVSCLTTIMEEESVMITHTLSGPGHRERHDQSREKPHQRCSSRAPKVKIPPTPRARS